MSSAADNAAADDGCSFRRHWSLPQKPSFASSSQRAQYLIIEHCTSMEAIFYYVCVSTSLCLHCPLPHTHTHIFRRSQPTNYDWIIFASLARHCIFTAALADAANSEQTYFRWQTHTQASWWALVLPVNAAVFFCIFLLSSPPPPPPHLTVQLVY